MQNLLRSLLLLVALGSALWLPAQVSTNCTDGIVTGSTTYNGTVFFNYGSVTNSYSIKNRTTSSLGEIFVGSTYNQSFYTSTGFYTRFLLPPSPPVVTATEGDLKDRIQVNWAVDALSPSAEGGFNIYRDGAFIDHVEKEIRVYVDFNVQAGQFYTYEIRGVNSFGQGSSGSSLGFLNPNGVVTGQVKTFSGNPVADAEITLTPTLGTSLAFTGDDVAFAEYNAAFVSPKWTVACWVKLGAGNNLGSILDFGSNLNKNWWLQTLATGSKGVKFNVGTGASSQSVSYTFATDPNGWHHVAAVYTGSSLLFYVDGNLIGTVAVAISNANSPLFFGRKPGAMSNYFTGNLDDVRLFNRQLSQTEINQYKNRTVNADANGLVAYWKLDEGVGVKGYDISANRFKTYLCGPQWSTDRPDVVNGAVTDASGFYKIEGINYGGGQTFTATPSKKSYDNYALEFNAANSQYVSLTDSVLLGVTQAAAVELRLQSFENVAATRTVLANQSSNGATNFFQLNLAGGNIKVQLGATIKDYGALGTGYQHLVVNMKKNGNSTDVSVYKNGALVSTQTFAVAFPNVSPQTWLVGAAKSGASTFNQYFSGLVDEVAFYDTTLTVAQIQLNNTTGVNSTNTRLRSWFPFNESRGTSLEDIGPSRTGLGAVQGALWSTVTAIANSTMHTFQPDKRLVTLNPSNTSTDQVDFTDLSTVSVSGYVRYDGTDCFEEAVEILVNGESATPKIFTDVNGKFVADFEPGTTAILTPKFSTHVFAPASWKITNLNAPVAGLLFRDMTRRSIRGKVSGGLCEKGIIGPGQNIKLTVATPGANPCYSRTITLNGDAEGGEKTFVFNNLPPRALNISVSFASNTAIYNYFQAKGGETVDLREANDTTDFNYIAPPNIEIVEGLEVNSCGDTMVEQLQRYTPKFKVYQAYAGGACYLDEAFFSFNNGIAGTPPFDTTMSGGTMRYSFRAGAPNLASPYKKTLTVTAMQADSQVAVRNLKAVVLGQSPTGTTFAATSPQMPFMILHDPPGDASSAYMQKSQTTCNTLTMSVSDGLSTADGVDVSLGYTTEIAAGVGILTITESELINTSSYEVAYSATDTRENTIGLCLTANEVLSTSGSDNLIGRDADVFLGAAINFDFGVNKILKYDSNACNFYIDKSIIAAPTGLATTYIYQRYDIVNQVIPNLLLSGLPTAAADIARWEQILADDDATQDAAVFEENISFSGGIYYEKSLTTDRSDSRVVSFDKALDHTVGDELGFTQNNAGAVAHIGLTIGSAATNVEAIDTATSNTVGYILNDDDLGDLFSVNVKKDRVYGTPVFQLVSGESSCPWEAPTQKRNYVSLTANTTAVANVNSHAAATFNLTLGNQSETDEDQTYTLSIGANPLGAIVKVEGQQLTATGIDFSIPAGQSIPVKLTVERGVLSYQYNDIEVILAASCEDGSIEGFSQNLLLDVEFIEPCSEVDIAFPMQNDVITSGQNSKQITIDGYDKSDPDLELVRIQYRSKFGDGSWINIQPQSTILKAALSPVSTSINWDVTTLDDGPYELRALTQCFGGNQAPGISTVINLRVEREAPQLLGLPQPADGVLSLGDEISITFNEEVNCATIIQADIFQNNNLGLYDTETGDLIDAVISCSDNKIVIVPNIQNAFIEGKILRVEVDDIEDLVGNEFGHAEWEFFVDRSPLDLEGGNLDVTMYEGEEKTVFRQLLNTGGSIATFAVTGTPSWLSVFPNTGILQPGEEVTITYKFAKTLPQGTYADTIYFENAQGNRRVIVNARVLCAPPAWTVDPTSHPLTMNFTVKLNIEGNISQDEEDIVAAFIDGELRGSAHVQFVPALDQYLAFLTVYGETGDEDEPIALEIWDASACLRYGQVLEQFDFNADNVVGGLNNATVLHTNSQVLREIPLRSGWNWISFNLQFPNPAVTPALASLLHPEDDLIKGQSAFAEYFSNAWFGSLTSLDNQHMFQYRADVPDTLKMIGALLNPASLNIPVVAGWNWIGYVPNYALPLNEALAGLTPLNGDIIKGQSAFAQYLAGFGWLGSLQFMEAPKGYQLKISNAGTLTYPNNLVGTDPELAMKVQAAKDKGQTVDAIHPSSSILHHSPSHWQIDPAQYEYSMTLIGMLSADGANATLASQEIGAFVGSELRGSAQAIYIAPLDAYLFFLTTYANTPGEQLHFKLFDGASGAVSELQETMWFASDLHQGSIEAPVPFTLPTSRISLEPGKTLSMEVQPNPFHEVLSIWFSNPRAERVSLSVTDAQGRLVMQESVAAGAGLNAYTWNAGSVAAGIYFVRLETADGVAVRKVVRE